MEIFFEWTRTGAVAEFQELCSVSVKSKAMHIGRSTNVLIGLRDP